MKKLITTLLIVLIGLFVSAQVTYKFVKTDSLTSRNGADDIIVGVGLDVYKTIALGKMFGTSGSIEFNSATGNTGTISISNDDHFHISNFLTTNIDGNVIATGNLTAAYNEQKKAYILMVDGSGNEITMADTTGLFSTSYFDLSATGGEISTKIGIDTLGLFNNGLFAYDYGVGGIHFDFVSGSNFAIFGESTTLSPAIYVLNGVSGTANFRPVTSYNSGLGGGADIPEIIVNGIPIITTTADGIDVTGSGNFTENLYISDTAMWGTEQNRIYNEPTSGAFYVEAVNEKLYLTSTTTDIIVQAGSNDEIRFKRGTSTTTMLIDPDADVTMYEELEVQDSLIVRGVGARILRLDQIGYNYFDFTIPLNQEYMTISDKGDIFMKFYNDAGIELNFNGAKRIGIETHGIDFYDDVYVNNVGAIHYPAPGTLNFGFGSLFTTYGITGDTYMQVQAATIDEISFYTSNTGMVLMEAGKMRVGSVVAPVATLDVTGDGNFTGDLTLEADLIQETIGLHLDLVGDDAGVRIDSGQLAVGSPALGKESVFGGGDSYPVPLAFHCDTVNFTGLAVTSATDVSTILQSYAGSTTGFFGGVTTGSALLVGSPYRFGGAKIKITTQITIGTGSFHGEYLEDNTPTWTDAPYMSTDANYPYTQYGLDICNADATSEQLRFGFDPTNVPPDWDTCTMIINGTSYHGMYWARFHVDDAITTDAIIEQVKMHTNRTEINADGTIEYFGLARTPEDFHLEPHVNALKNPANETVQIASGISAILIDNELQDNAEDGRVYFGRIGEGIDTSIPLTFSFGWYKNAAGTGNVEFFIDVIHMPGGFVFDGTATPTLSYSVVVAVPTVTDALTVTQFQVPISLWVPGEAIAISIYRDATAGNANDTYGGSVVNVGTRAIVYHWR